MIMLSAALACVVAVGLDDESTPSRSSGQGEVERASADAEPGAPERPEDATGGTGVPATFDHSLFGDWGGFRSSLANAGVTFDLQWTQSLQGVVKGGLDNGWKYGGSVDLQTSLDLGQMNLLPGGFVRVLVQGRYGESVIEEAGTVLPVNTDLFIPITGELDEEIISVTELLYTQFFSKQFGVTLGKLQTLDGDPNEFASGRGRSQFMNFSFVAPNLTGNAIPYSTLGAGVVIIPTKGIVITSLVMNTTDSSTTSGFDDIGDGTTWLTEAQFQYRLGALPGGMNVGFAYAFDNEFLNFNRSGLTGSGIRIENKEDTWTLYWSGWQYLLTLDDAPETINPGDGRPDVRGLGLFARAGLVDEDTSIVNWSGSIGLGGRGLIPTRDEDVFGIGFQYTDFNDDQQLTQLLKENESYGMEAFYNAALAPGVGLTADVQVLEPAPRGVGTTVVAGLRLNIRF